MIHVRILGRWQEWGIFLNHHMKTEQLANQVKNLATTFTTKLSDKIQALTTMMRHGRLCKREQMEATGHLMDLNNHERVSDRVQGT